MGILKNAQKIQKIPRPTPLRIANFDTMLGQRVANKIANTAARGIVAKRTFATSGVQRSGHFHEGPYSNLPFQVHNRRVPYAVLHFGFLGLGFAIPFVACGYHMYKAGCFN